MKKITWLVLAAAALFSSCQKQESFTYEGKPVSFSASTSNINTKTAYQGSTQNGKEAILWEDGDTFTVFSNEASIAGSSRKWANYKVTVSGGVATAVSPVSDELLWGRGLHHFYALYPAGDITGNTVNAAISASQDLTESSPGVFAPNLSQEGYMAAAADGNPGDPTVLLNFKPMFTTLEFVVGPGYDSDVHVGGFSLKVKDGSKVVLSGGFKATLSSQADPEIAVDYSGASGEIKVYFGEDGLIVKKGESLTFSVLALPIELTDLVAVFTLDGVVREYPLVDEDGKYIKIEAGQKARITALGLLNPSKYKTVFSISIDSQTVTEYNFSVPGNVPGYSGPFGNLYFSKGYLTQTGEDSFTVSGDDQLEILKYFGEDFSVFPTHYLEWTSSYTASISGFSVPTQEQSMMIIGYGSENPGSAGPLASFRPGATVNGEANKHYALVYVNLSGTPYEEYGFSGDNTIQGLLLFPDGADLQCPELSFFDAIYGGTAGTLSYDRLLSLCQGVNGCAFLPSAGMCFTLSPTINWDYAGMGRFYWTSSEGSHHGTVYRFGDDGAVDYSIYRYPIRLVKVINE